MGNKNGTPVLRQEDIEVLCSSSGLDEKQVRECFESFVSAHPNGRMKKGDFREMMEKALPREDAKKMEKHVFRLFDTNNDGSIDFTEFMLVFLIFSDGSPEEVLTRIFRVFDVNSDGFITKKELQKLLKDMHGLIKADDADKATDEMIATTTLTEMDENGDGRITLEEYIKACLEKEEFSKMLTLKIIDIFIDEDSDSD